MRTCPLWWLNVKENAIKCPLGCCVVFVWIKQMRYNVLIIGGWILKEEHHTIFLYAVHINHMVLLVWSAVFNIICQQKSIFLDESLYPLYGCRLSDKNVNKVQEFKWWFSFKIQSFLPYAPIRNTVVCKNVFEIMIQRSKNRKLSLHFCAFVHKHFSLMEQFPKTIANF